MTCRSIGPQKVTAAMTPYFLITTISYDVPQHGPQKVTAAMTPVNATMTPATLSVQLFSLPATLSVQLISLLLYCSTEVVYLKHKQYINWQRHGA
jgi:hypothetical protein